MKVELISWTKNPIMTIAHAASTCYQSEPNIKIVKGCIKSGHYSVVEHCNFTFEIKEISRALLTQLTRHRIASYSVLSQRYCDSSNADFVVPNSKNRDMYLEYYDKSKNAYVSLCEAGEKKEDARMVLPNGCCTTIVMTMNLRSLANFMNERLCSRSQWEIRNMAKEMKKVVLECPDLKAEEKEIIELLLVPKCEKEAIKYCPEHSGCGKYKSLKTILAEKDSEIKRLWETLRGEIDNRDCENYNF